MNQHTPYNTVGNLPLRPEAALSNQDLISLFNAMLADIQESTAPFGLARGESRPFKHACRDLGQPLNLRLKDVARKLNVGVESIVYLAWSLVLARFAAREDVAFGAVSGRQGKIVPMRVNAGEGPAGAAAQETHHNLKQLHALEPVLPTSRPGEETPGMDMLSAAFGYFTAHAPVLAEDPLAGAWPLTVIVEDTVERFTASSWTQSPAEPERVCAFVRTALEKLADVLEAAPEMALTEIDVMPEDERHKTLVEWNDTCAPYPRDKCVHQLFEEQAAKTPRATAVVHGDRQLTYAELNLRANRLAHYLRATGVRPDSRVAICLERGPDMVVGLLAILKAGGAYAPLDPAYPAERLAYMAQDCAPAALLTTPAMKVALSHHTGELPIIVPETDAEAWADWSTDNPNAVEVGVTPENLAYVIYTSGSTGKPKGVAMPHRPLVNLVSWQNSGGAPKRTLQFAALGFDVSFQETFSALCSGAPVILVDDHERFDFEKLADRIRANRVERLFLPYVALQAFADHVSESLGADGAAGSDYCVEEVITAGEQLRITPSILKMAGRLKGVTLHNHYGPSETHVATAFVLPKNSADWPVLPPIGRPIPNARIYILDAKGRPAPIGVAGDVFIGGDCVARGYLDRPDMTAERFVADPFAPGAGAKMYKTGDLGRWLPNGEIEFLGRGDFQVKIRGFRVELGEIEARLAEHPGVKETAVLAREDVSGQKRLVAYYVGDSGVSPASQRAHLSARLPEYMVPAAYVRMGRMPLSPNGKLDRKALPAPGADAYAAREYEAPQGELETNLAKIWSELLKIDQVGRQDNFFDLGGHSLMALQVASRVRKTLGLEATLGDLFAHPVLADFAAVLSGGPRATLDPIPPADRSKPLPMSDAQQRLWFLTQMEGASEAYHLFYNVRLSGALDRIALRRALDRIVERHEPLRTTFAQIDGEPMQCIAPAGGFALSEHDLRGKADAEAALDKLAAEEAGAPFDLEQGPMIRGRLAQLADDEHAMLVTMHHIASDGWSMGVFVEELNALYGAFVRGEADPLSELPLQYADYSEWRRRFEGGVPRQQAEYWTAALSGAPELIELPTDRPRPPQVSYTGARAEVELDAELSQKLKALSRRHGATLYITLLAGWAALMSRLSGQGEVVIGAPAANRSRAEAEQLIGFFVNTLALRVDLQNEPTVAELLAQVKATMVDAHCHEDIPFEKVVEAVRPRRSLAHSPIFQVMFAWQNAPVEQLELPGLKATPFSAPTLTTQFDLLLSLEERDARIVGGLDYSTALFDAGSVEGWLGCFRVLLNGMAEDDARPIGQLPLLEEKEWRRVVVDLNDTAVDYPRDVCIQQLFEAQAAKTPDATALSFEDLRFTYAELNARANRLSRYLRTLGVGPERLVGVCAERSDHMVVALLAVLKAGGAYVPLDPEYPSARLKQMVDDSSPAALLADANSIKALREAGIVMKVIDMCAEARNWAGMSDANPDYGAMGLTATNLAYMIYTSGSTGVPKGAMNEHRGVVNRLMWMQDAYGLGANDVVLQKTPFSFDVSVWEFFWPLMTGARLTVARPGGHRDPSYLGEIIKREQVTTLHFVPSMLDVFLASDAPASCASVKRVICSGEALPAALASRFHERMGKAELHNLYGPTEAAVDVTAWACLPGADGASIPIGRPIANTRIYILDPHGQPTPFGVAGEIFIGGVQVGRGYLNRPELTEERFVLDPFSAEPGARMYKTGDLGRWRPDEAVEYLGRNDFQVKIRGFRIELGEIEARLASHPCVREAAVVARDDGAGDKRLAAYWTGEGGASAETLRAYLIETLPEYMAPSAYVWLERMPLSPNGKLDRKELPAPSIEAYSAREYEAPIGPVETQLAAIWGETLKVERVGRRDNFFDLGGHSLLAIRLLARVEAQFGKQYSLTTLFKSPTVETFAAEIRAGGPQEPDSPNIVFVQREGTRNPIFAINTPSAYYNLARRLGSDQPFVGLQLISPFEQKEFADCDFAGIAAEYVRLVRQVQPTGPYSIIGWCVGGALAVKAARMLEDQGEAISFVGVVDGSAPGVMKRLGPTKAKIQHFSVRLQAFAKRWSEQVKTGRDAARFLGAPLRARLQGLLTSFLGSSAQEDAGDVSAETNPEILARQLSELADRHELRPLRSKIAVFWGETEPRGWFVDEALGWRGFARAGVDTVKITGDHYSVLKEPGASEIASHIRKVLRLQSPL